MAGAAPVTGDAPDWSRAACSGHPDPNLWQDVMIETTRGGKPRIEPHHDPVRAAQAKAICGGCPIRVECGQWGTAEDEEGIWGGLTRAERNRSDSPSQDPEEAAAVCRCVCGAWRQPDQPCRVCAALDARRDCATCADIAAFRRFGWTWVRISKHMGMERSWAQTHAQRHNLRDPKPCPYEPLYHGDEGTAA